jgi:hypothetical protein
MSKYKFILVGLMLVSLNAFAQQTRSKLVYNKAASFGYDVHITNDSNVPITATAAISKHNGHSGSVDSSVRITDAVFQWPNDKPLAPGQTMTFNMGPSGPPGHEPAEISLLAPVFADGTTEGDQEWVALILEQRRRAFMDLTNCLAMLRQSLVQKVDGGALLARFQALRAENRANVAPRQAGSMAFFQRTAAERVASTVIGNLENKLVQNQTSEDSKKAVQSTIEFLQSWFKELQASKPAL